MGMTDVLRLQKRIDVLERHIGQLRTDVGALMKAKAKPAAKTKKKPASKAKKSE